MPVCSTCERSGKRNQCSNAIERSSTGKDRSDVAAIESKIDRLEKKVAQAASGRIAHASTDATLRSAVDGIYHPNGVGRRNVDIGELQDMNDLVSDFGFL